jgi:hypothetical protein
MGKRDTLAELRAYLWAHGVPIDDGDFGDIPLPLSGTPGDMRPVDVMSPPDSRPGFEAKLERVAEAAAKVGDERGRLSVENALYEVRRTRERRSFGKLFDGAATTLTVTEAPRVDDVRDLIERLRREDYGVVCEEDPSSIADVVVDASGTFFLCGVEVVGALRDAVNESVTRGAAFDIENLAIEGVPVVEAKHAPNRSAVLVDRDALAIRAPPFEPADPEDPRFDVRDGRGIAALEWVDGGS